MTSSSRLTPDSRAKTADDRMPRPSWFAQELGWKIPQNNRSYSWADLMAEAGRRYLANSSRAQLRKATK